MMIRHARTDDTEQMIKLVRQLGYEIKPDELSANLRIYEKLQGYVFVSEENGKLSGFVSGIFIPLFHAHEMMFRVTALCVEEEKRGQGRGNALLQKIEELCLKNGCNYLEVTSGAQRKKDAHVFYEHLGYAPYKGKRFTKRLDKESRGVR